MEVSKNKTDAITGLPLYDSFLEIAQTEIDNNPSKMLVLISTDIANFKYVNKIYGYNKANELINELISVIQDDNQEIVCACRTHSDHIISLFRYNGDREDFVKTVDDDSNRFVKRNSRKYPSVSLHLNNGVVFLDDEDDDLIYSIDKANVARRIAKGNYCVTSVVYSSEMMGRKEEDAKIMAMFDHAIKNGNIKTFFQPKMDIKGQKIIGAEVLSRIYDVNGNMMMPDSYIPVLENSGKVVELDRYVMRETFSAIRNWIDRGWNVVPVSINLSRMNFYEDNIAEHIYTEFCKYNIPIEYIELELTESLFFAETNTMVNEISKLREYGFCISMDDFGMGYSALSSLSTLPVDIIKFDKEFIRNSMSNDAGYQILNSLIGVFKKINYDVICEGIETREQEKMIFECGCDNVQGFLYDKPLERSQFEEKYIKNN